MSVDVETKFTDPQVLLETFDKYIDRITEWLDQIEAFMASAGEAEATIAKEADRIIATFPNGAVIQLCPVSHPEGKVLAASNLERIAELFPNVITESHDPEGNVTTAVDFDLLRQELSDHVVDGPQERYRLDWPGKRAAAFAANTPIAKTLRPVREESVDFDTTKNLFIEGDNLEALKLLQESYLGKVKLIYIDPPYNTGNDFVYEDDFAESNVDYLERSGQTLASGERLVANPESNGRFHSDWLSMMYPRLRLARNLLSSDGFIFISIDEGEQAALRHICDEVFGTPSYVTTIMWRRKRETSNDSKNVAIQGEFILVYARSVEGALALEPLAEDYVAASYRDPTSEFPEGRW